MVVKYAAFDIETGSEFPDGADWRDYRPLSITCAAVCLSDVPRPVVWHGTNADGSIADQMRPNELYDLVHYLTNLLARGYTIVTWNGLGFDFDVLAEESGLYDDCRKLALNHVDMMFHLFCVKGWPLSLNAAAMGMGLPGKTIGMDGREAVMAWKAPDRRWDVMRYVEQDARTTLDLALVCGRERRLNWVSRRGNLQTLYLPNGWYPVSSSIELPEPDTSWMDSPILRSDFTLWLERDERLCRKGDSWPTQDFGRTDAWGYVRRGDDYAQKSDYDRAIADYERAIELDPRCAEVLTIHISYMDRGDLHRGKGDYDYAIADYDRAIELYPSNAELYQKRGNTYSQKGDYSSASADYDRAHAITTAGMGADCVRAGDYDQAIAYCNTAIELFPKFTGAYYTRGQAYVVKGYYEHAIADCSNAIELDPTYAAAYYLRAVAYARTGDNSQAMVDYGRATELEPIYAETEYRRPVANVQKEIPQSHVTGRGCMTPALLSLAVMSFLAFAYFW